MGSLTILVFFLATLHLAPRIEGYQAATALDVASPEASEDDGSGSPHKPRKPIRADDVQESPEAKSEPKSEAKSEAKSKDKSKSVEEPAEEEKDPEPKEMAGPEVVETKYSDEKSSVKDKEKGEKGGKID